MYRRRLVLLSLSLVVAGLILAFLSRYYSNRPDHRLQRGQQALEQGNYALARRQAERLKESGYSDHAHLLSAQILYRQARFFLDGNRPREGFPLLAEALGQIDQIRDQEALRLEGAALAGQCFLYEQNLNEAARHFSYVLDQNPDHVDAHRGLAAIYYDLGALPRTVYHLEAVARLDPQDGRAYRLMGLIWKDLDSPGLAAECYDKALNQNLSSQMAGAVRLELAEVLVKQMKFPEAMQALPNSEATNLPGDRVLAVQAECLRGQGNLPQAGTLLDRNLSKYPGSVPLLVLRAKLHLEGGEAQAAITLLERALAIQPNDYAGHFQLAQAYQHLGRSREAAEHRRRSQEIKTDLEALVRLNEEANQQPWDAALRLRLAELCQKLGLKPEADMWRRAAQVCAASSEKK
jgi:tetratricopeptide (TPR) repeat protein